MLTELSDWLDDDSELNRMRKVLKPKLIAVFIGAVGCGILFTGFLFNLII
jgi:uncharacterized protein